MSKGLEALHLPRIKSARVDISAEGKHDIAYMFFDDTKQYAAIEKELKALEIIKNVGAIAFYLDKWKIQQVISQEEYNLLKEVLL